MTLTPLEIVTELDDPQPPNPHREAAQKFYQLMREAILFITSAPSPHLAILAVAYVLEISEITELSMRERCRCLGYSHNAVSKYARAFRSKINLNG